MTQVNLKGISLISPSVQYLGTRTFECFFLSCYDCTEEEKNITLLSISEQFWPHCTAENYLRVALTYIFTLRPYLLIYILQAFRSLQNFIKLLNRLGIQSSPLEERLVVNLLLAIHILNCTLATIGTILEFRTIKLVTKKILSRLISSYST